jgi:hypothetical protein
MSNSMYRGQVDRLKGEIADLEAKAANERSRATRERGEAQRIAGSITRSTSASSAQSKARDSLRHEDRANGHDKKAAGYDKAIATKGRQLTTAQASLDRVLDQQRKKDETTTKRRQAEDLRHIRDLESRRRSLESPIDTLDTPLATAARPARAVGEFEYDVCLSFAGEERSYVEMVARGLKERGVRVFYDVDEKVNVWGKDLAEHFDHVYRTASRYCVMFVSEAYAAKPWTRHERRAALARALVDDGEYVLPARFDDTELPGLRPTVGWVDLREVAPATLVDFVLEKIGVASEPDDSAAESGANALATQDGPHPAASEAGNESEL